MCAGRRARYSGLAHRSIAWCPPQGNCQRPSVCPFRLVAPWSSARIQPPQGGLNRDSIRVRSVRRRIFFAQADAAGASSAGASAPAPILAPPISIISGASVGDAVARDAADNHHAAGVGTAQVDAAMSAFRSGDRPSALNAVAAFARPMRHAEPAMAPAWVFSKDWARQASDCR